MVDEIRALIVDDERLARKDLRRLLSHHKDINIVGEAENISEAVNIINTLSPALVFLDIQLSDESGFSLLDHINHTMQVVFVTAYDHYAVRAFEVNALDYVLKPVHSERLAQTLVRIRKAINTAAEMPQPEPFTTIPSISDTESPGDQRRDEEEHDEEEHEQDLVNQDLSNTERSSSPDTQNRKYAYEDFIFVKAQERSGFIKVNNILSLTATGNYTMIHLVTGEQKIVLRPMRDWENSLPEQFFVRVHRNTIININFVEKVEPWSNSSYRIFINHIKEPIIASRRYSTRLREKFQ